MLKEKLINVKLILRIMISVLIIFSMFKSCAKAYTANELQIMVKEDTQKLINGGILGTNFNINNIEAPFSNTSNNYYFLYKGKYDGRENTYIVCYFNFSPVKVTFNNQWRKWK